MKNRWLAEMLPRDEVLRRLQGRVERRLRQWELRHAVMDLRRLGVAAPVATAAARFGVSAKTVTRALRETARAASR